MTHKTFEITEKKIEKKTVGDPLKEKSLAPLSESQNEAKENHHFVAAPLARFQISSCSLLCFENS